QAHTARAVNDLKGSFETVITQIGRQLEQMRGQFDATSRGMRETAQQTANDLESLRQEMQKRMAALPEHTAQATAAIRKALSEQLREIETITQPVLSRPAPQGPAAEPFRPAPPSGMPPASAPFEAGPMPHFDSRGRQVYSPEQDMGHVPGGLAPQLARARPGARAEQGPGQRSVGAPQAPGPAGPPASAPFEAGPRPHFDARGRQVYSPEQDMGHVAGGLAQQLAGAGPAARPSQGAGQWSVGDLLSRASAEPQSFGARAAPPQQSG